MALTLSEYQLKSKVAKCRRKTELFQQYATHFIHACLFSVQDIAFPLNLSQSFANQKFSSNVKDPRPLEMPEFISTLALLQTEVETGNVPIIVPLALFRLLDDKFVSNADDRKYNEMPGQESASEILKEKCGELGSSTLMFEMESECWDDISDFGYFLMLLNSKLLLSSSTKSQINMVSKIATPKFLEMFCLWVEWQADFESSEKKEKYAWRGFQSAVQDRPLEWDEQGFCNTLVSDKLFERTEQAAKKYIWYLMRYCLRLLIDSTSAPQKQQIDLLDMADDARKCGFLKTVKKNEKADGVLPPESILKDKGKRKKYGVDDVWAESLS